MLDASRSELIMWSLEDGRCLLVRPQAVPWCPTALKVGARRCVLHGRWGGVLTGPPAKRRYLARQRAQLTSNSKYMLVSGRSSEVAVVDTATLEVQHGVLASARPRVKRGS